MESFLFAGTLADIVRRRFSDFSSSFGDYNDGFDDESYDVFRSSPNKQKTDEDSFVLLVLNVPLKNGKMKQNIREFSHPVIRQEVEDWSDLYDIWFFEIPVDLSTIEWCKIAENPLVPNTRTALTHNELEPEKAYLVCGYTFQDDDFIPEYDQSEIQKISPSVDSSPNTSRKMNRKEEIIRNFQTITEMTFRQAYVFVSKHDFDLEKAFEDYYSFVSLVPHWAIPSKRREMYQSMFSRSTSIGEEFNIDLSIRLSDHINPPLSVLLLVNAFEGHLERTKILLKLPFIQNDFTDLNGRSVIHYSALGKKHKILDELLKHEELIPLLNKFDENNNSPFRYAVIYDRFKYVKKLTDFMITRKIPLIELEARSRITLITLCMYSDKPFKETRMLKQFLRFNNIHVEEFVAISPIAYAVMECRLDWLQLFAEYEKRTKQHGIIINQKSGSGLMTMLPLISCCKFAEARHHGEENMLPLLEFLLVYGCDPKIKDQSGKSALEWARTLNFMKMYELMLEACKDPEDRAFIIVDSVKKNKIQIFKKELLKYVKETKNFSIGVMKNTILHYCVNYNRLEFVKIIISGYLKYKDQKKSIIGENLRKIVFSKNLFDRSPLYCSKLYGRLEIFDYFKKLNIVDSRETDCEGISTQHVFSNKSFVCSKLLLSINSKSIDVDESISSERFQIWDSLGKGLLEDIFHFSNFSEQLLTKTYERFNFLRRHVPSVYVYDERVQEFPSILLPRSVNFDQNQISNFYDCELSGKFHGMLINRELMVSVPPEKAFDIYIKQTGFLVDFAAMMTILHHLGICHNNLRLSSVMFRNKYSVVSEEDEGIYLLNFGNPLQLQFLADTVKKDNYFYPPSFHQNSAYWTSGTEELDILNFAQIVAISLFEKPIQYNAFKRLNTTTSDAKVTDLVVEVVKMSAEAIGVHKVKMKTFYHALVKSWRLKIHEFRNKMGERSMTTRDNPLLIVANTWEKKIEESVSKREQCLYSFTIKSNLEPKKFYNIVEKNFLWIFNKLMELNNEFSIGMEIQVEKMKEYIYQFVNPENISKEPKIKLPNFTCVFFSKLISHAKRPGRGELWFPILDILWVLSTIQEFKKTIATEIMFTVILKNIFRAKVQKMSDGAIVDMGKFLCNVLSENDGRDLLFSEEMFAEIEDFTICCLKNSKLLLFRTGVRILEHLAWSGHLYRDGKNGLRYTKIICTCIDSVFCNHPEKHTNDTKWSAYVECVGSILFSLYTYLKFDHRYKRKFLIYSKKMDLLKRITMLDVFFSNNEGNDGLKRNREILVSLGAMLLGPREWAKLKIKMFTKFGLHDPFRSEDVFLHTAERIENTFAGPTRGTRNYEESHNRQMEQLRNFMSIMGRGGGGGGGGGMIGDGNRNGNQDNSDMEDKCLVM